MDGGRAKWLDEGRELTTDVPSYAPRPTRAQERDESLRAFRDHILEMLATRPTPWSTCARRRSTRAS